VQSVLTSSSVGSLQRFYFRNGDHCPFCNETLLSTTRDMPIWEAQSLSFCQLCGWWRSDVDVMPSDVPNVMYFLDGPFGIYRFTCVQNISHLDVQSAESKPIQLIRDHLTRDWGSRQFTHPRNIEEVVGSIYSSFGATVLVTQYSGDGGIDIIVEQNGEIFGVQVKRYNRRISLSQIREFIGALVVNRLPKGVFVTTSSFQRGARNLVSEALQADIKIELIDGDALFSELRNAQRCELDPEKETVG